MTADYVAGKHLVDNVADPLAHILGQIDGLFSKYGQPWAKLSLPQSALGRLQLFRTCVLARAEGATERMREAWRETKRYGLESEDTPAVFRKLLLNLTHLAGGENSNDSTPPAGRPRLNTCGCTFDVRRCQAHSSVRCECRHVGMAVLCDDHYHEWQGKYDMTPVDTNYGVSRPAE